MICESRMNRTQMKPSAGTSERSLIQQRYDFYGSIHVFTQDNESAEVRFVLKLLESSQVLLLYMKETITPKASLMRWQKVSLCGPEPCLQVTLSWIM